MKKLLLSAVIVLCFFGAYAEAGYALFQQRKIELESGALSGDHTEELERLNRILEKLSEDQNSFPIFSGDVKFKGVG